MVGSASSVSIPQSDGPEQPDLALELGLPCPAQGLDYELQRCLLTDTFL